MTGNPGLRAYTYPRLNRRCIERNRLTSSALQHIGKGAGESQSVLAAKPRRAAFHYGSIGPSAVDE